MTITDITKEEECCCSCKHNIREKEKSGIYCECEIDGHYINYVACFERVCEMWEEAENERHTD